MTEGWEKGDAEVVEEGPVEVWVHDGDHDHAERWEFVASE